MITVLIVDDHQLVRAGLGALVESADDMVVIAQAPDGAAAVEAAVAHKPDVILMDLSMPVMDGVEATRGIIDLLPETRVVVLTSFSDKKRVAAALEAGAVGYLLKDSEPSVLLAAIRAAALGHAPIDPRVARALLPTKSSGPEKPDLSPREHEVLLLVSQGLANKQIARRLGITERTVKSHVGSVFRRINVADRTSAALWARDHLPPVDLAD